jgi:hypothetical protein
MHRERTKDTNRKMEEQEPADVWHPGGAFTKVWWGSLPVNLYGTEETLQYNDK